MTLPSLGEKKTILARKPLCDFARSLIFLRKQFSMDAVEETQELNQNTAGKTEERQVLPWPLMAAASHKEGWLLSEPCVFVASHTEHGSCCSVFEERFHDANRTSYFPSDMKHSWSPKRKKKNHWIKQCEWHATFHSVLHPEKPSRSAGACTGSVLR